MTKDKQVCPACKGILVP